VQPSGQLRHGKGTVSMNPLTASKCLITPRIAKGVPDALA